MNLDFGYAQKKQQCHLFAGRLSDPASACFPWALIPHHETMYGRKELSRRGALRDSSSRVVLASSSQGMMHFVKLSPNRASGNQPGDA